MPSVRESVRPAIPGVARHDARDVREEPLRRLLRRDQDPENDVPRGIDRQTVGPSEGGIRSADEAAHPIVERVGLRGRGGREDEKQKREGLTGASHGYYYDGLDDAP